LYEKLKIFAVSSLELLLRRKSHIYKHIESRDISRYRRVISIYICLSRMIERRWRTATFDLCKVCNLFHLCNLLPHWQKRAFKHITMKT